VRVVGGGGAGGCQREKGRHQGRPIPSLAALPLVAGILVGSSAEPAWGGVEWESPLTPSLGPPATRSLQLPGGSARLRTACPRRFRSHLEHEAAPGRGWATAVLETCRGLQEYVRRGLAVLHLVAWRGGAWGRGVRQVGRHKWMGVLGGRFQGVAVRGGIGPDDWLQSLGERRPCPAGRGLVDEPGSLTVPGAGLAPPAAGMQEHATWWVRLQRRGSLAAALTGDDVVE
jgi:hypothetical protein